MIISASRRTDLPCHYPDWLTARLREGFVLVPNPYFPTRLQRVSLAPDALDGIVFWTKNPAPFLGYLHAFADIPSYFQFTLTPYGADVEPGLPSKPDVLVPTFLALGARLGAERVVWRYDPILLSPKYTIAYHLRAFAAIAERLRGSTLRCTFSFLDSYRHIEGRMRALGAAAPTRDQQLLLAEALAQIAHDNGMCIDTCAEALPLERFGIGHARCIDAELLSRIAGRPIRAPKARGQREACGCCASIDIGTYATCPSACAYCYANRAPFRPMR